MPEITQRVIVRMVTEVTRVENYESGLTVYTTTEDLMLPAGTSFYFEKADNSRTRRLIFEQDLEIVKAPEQPEQPEEES